MNSSINSKTRRHGNMKLSWLCIKLYEQIYIIRIPNITFIKMEKRISNIQKLFTMLNINNNTALN